jgi:hypothetical protein
MKIPLSTREKLEHPAPPGQRHEQIIRIALELARAGNAANEIFHTLRPRYDDDVTNLEIWDGIKWAMAQKGVEKRPSRYRGPQPQRTSALAGKTDPIARIKQVLKGFSCEETDLLEASPCRPLEDWQFDSLMFLSTLYESAEQINIVTQFTCSGSKANPIGMGVTKHRDDWLGSIRDHGTPQGEAGAWIRMNPTDGRGIADKNITAHRFALLEWDDVPLNLQLALLSRLPLPISAILASGGKSLHAWVRVDAPDETDYRETVGKMLSFFKRLGVDQANKNPGRLSRLVGAQRIIGAGQDGRQRLLYLNPKPERKSIL